MKVRDVFFSEIYDRAGQGEDIVIVSSDIGAPSLDGFRKRFGSRFVNVGIAEQNLLAVSAGLAFGGKKAIAYGLNPFPVTRAFDQVRNFMASMQLPITLTALNAGTCSAEAGYTHMPIENLSIMRTLKNIKTVNPSDETIARMLAHEALDNPGPRYVQFDKYIEGIRYAEAEVHFDKGYAIRKNGRIQDTAIVTYGIWAQECLDAGLGCDIIDCFCLPVDGQAFASELQNYKNIVTIEDGILTGGLGSMALEILNRYGIDKKIIRYGLDMEHGYPKTYTDRESVWKDAGMSMDALKGLLGQLNGSVENG